MESASPESARAAPDAGGPDDDSRILVVDDNPSIHDDFRKIFAPDEEGSDSFDELDAAMFDSAPARIALYCTIDTASQGEEALACLEAARGQGRPYAVAFVDIRMPPGWNGVETARKLLSEDPYLQVVLCTAYSDFRWEEIVSALGNTDRVLILKKPFSVIEVQQLAYSLIMKWRLMRTSERQKIELEHRVAVRTMELSHANEQLRREMAERARVEEELRKAQRLEALGRLAAGLGHEINNPLGFVAGSIEMIEGELARLRRWIPAGETGPIEEAVRAAAVGVDRIAKIVNDVRLFSRPSDIPVEPVDIWRSLTGCVKAIEDRLDPEVALIVDLADMPAVLGKRVEIEQVFINLLENAVQAVGEVEGPQRRIQVSAQTDERGDVVVVIADTGPGIREDALDKVFDPFFTTKPPDQGTGLGLSICHSIVTALGGDIDVGNREEGGAVVTVRLPAVPEGEEAAPVEPYVETPAPDRKGRVLVVDDEPLMLRIMVHALREHEVVAVQNADEGLAKYREQPFDVIFCDVMMPGLGSRGFYEALAQEHPGAEERIIFITGGARGVEAQSFLDGVSNECLEKPIPTEVLRARVNQALHAGKPMARSAPAWQPQS